MGRNSHDNISVIVIDLTTNQDERESPKGNYILLICHQMNYHNADIVTTIPSHIN